MKNMSDMLKEEANITYTENGAVTYRSTGSDCLDLFASIGAVRNESENSIISKFIRAYTEDSDMAMKILFYGRDIRGGLGERRVFRVILKWLADNKSASVIKNIRYIAEFGRWDDILCLFGTKCEKDALELIREQFDKDRNALDMGNEVSLMAKWLPSVNASNKQTVYYGKKVAKALGLKDEDYRKILTTLRAQIKIIENNLREKDYSFDYEKQPSRAMFKYKSAFLRNDHDRYTDFLSKVSKGEAALHADNLSPYELVETYLNAASGCQSMKLTEDIKNVLNTSWNALPDFCSDENALAVIDTSGSMYSYYNPRPASVALSLGIYMAEHNTGIFHNQFITFSNSPKFIEIKGETFTDKLAYLYSLEEIADTNLEAVFDLILAAAVRNKVSQEELPSKLIIISDLQFNQCVANSSLTNFQNAKKKFAEYGYKLPDIVFWNAAARNTQQPVTKNELGVALISGVTPRIFSMVAGGIASPYTLMMDVIGSGRYDAVAA